MSDEILRKARTERYILQSVARIALPTERVNICLRHRIHHPENGKYEEVKVWKHLQTQKAFYSGLVVCGSVWTCPVCAAKISERRRIELKHAFDTHHKNDGKIALLTLTFRHSRDDDLKEIMERFIQATSRFKSGKRFNNLRKKMGMIGSVRDFEITWSERNGFHPHVHYALFYENEIDLEELKNEFFNLWSIACKKFGLSVIHGVGCDLRDGSKADEYLAKYGNWSLEHELSKSHIKKGRFDSLTPFDFLRMYLSNENRKYLDLYKIYAKTMKGKRQLYWSRGLKKRFFIEEKSDEELAKEKLEEADLLGIIDYQLWKDVCNFELRSKLLDYIEVFGFEDGFNLILNKIKILKSDTNVIDTAK